MHDSVPSASYSSVCNVLRQWNIQLIPTYRVGKSYIHNYNYFNLNGGGGRPCMLNASTLISVQAIIMSVHAHVHVYTYSVKTV